MSQLFRPVDPSVSFPDLETGILDFWRDNDIFKRSIEERPEDNLFVFYEGPPTANGRPGVHHIMPRVIKDLFARYKTMRGYRVPRKAGWDTHGLPVEIEVEKELGLSSKPEIEEFGIAEFNAQCRESVGRYVRDFEELTERIAFWADMDNPYVTYDNDYIESGWWIFKQLWDHGLVYQDYRSTPHCPRCETSLSDHELSQGYRDDVPDPSVYIKFRLPPEARERIGLADGPAASIVAWTTTPWTLPGNTALAVMEDATYGLYEHEGEQLILAEALSESVLGEEREALRTYRGSELVGLAYEPLYRPEEVRTVVKVQVVEEKDGPPIDELLVKAPPQYVRRFDSEGHLQPLIGDESTEGLRRVIAADHVSLDDGTGIVHIAPAFGGEDFEDGKRHKLLFAQPVKPDGTMADELPGGGLFVKEADREVTRDLNERGLLLRSERIKHTYPFCWRCDSPVLYYAKPSWYLRTTRVRDRLLSGNDRINWQPDHIKHGRFGNWLENNVDWAVSRERYWGTPLPIWECHWCDNVMVIGSREELKKHAVSPAKVEDIEDLHRPEIDEIMLYCERCRYEIERVPEVADAWFDSGAMPYAQWHYPFENQDEFDRQFPADFICEAIDQTRGWFYTLHAEAALLNAAEATPEEISYRNVICHGHILDEQGNKMSKSRGNVLEPFDVLDELGADAVRWYIYASAPVGSSRRFSVRLMNESLRRFQLTLWNVYSFFVSYANIDGLDPRQRPQGEPPELDRWLLSELNALTERVTAGLDDYDPTVAARAIESFVDDLSNWYVRRSRRRFWRGVSGDDADKRSAYFTLHTALTTLARLLAPFTPFLAEELWANLARSIDGDAPESVHLADWPDLVPLRPEPSGGHVDLKASGTAGGGLTGSARLKVIDESLNAETQLVKRVASMGRAARAKAAIKVRQPLSEVLVRPRDGAEAATLVRNEALLLEELNVKALATLEDETGVVTFDVKPNLPVLGPRLGREVGAVRSALAALDAGEVVAAVRAGQNVAVAGHDLAPDDFLVEMRESEGYAVASEAGYTVAIATAVTPELADEGVARELVRHIQDLRREADFELSDRITTWCAGDETVARVLDAHGDYVEGETLSVELFTEPPPADAQRTAFTLDGVEVVVGVRRRDA